MIKHKFGALNKVVDALSRRTSLLASFMVSVPSFARFFDLYSSEPYFVRILSNIHDGKQTNFVIHDDFLFRGNGLRVSDCSLSLQIIRDLHNEGHVG